MKNTLSDSLSRIFAMLDNLGAANGPSDLTESKLEQNLLITISRHQNAFDWLTDQHATGKVRPRTRKVLRWALAEILCLSGVPAPHVVDAATAFVKRRHSPQEAGFVNACLRSICANLEHKDDFFASAPEHIRLRLPLELWNKWLTEFGDEKAHQIAGTLLQPSETYLRLRQWPAQSAPAKIHGLLPVEAPSWAPQQLLYKLDRQKHVSLSDVFHTSARFYIQDPATLLAPAMLNVKPGEVVADLCAAPGGKSILLAEAMKDAGMLFVSDLHEEKLPRLKENLAPFTCAMFSQRDATQFTPAVPCDAILLDVPCSNTGVFRRKPDAKWSFSTAKLDELTALQAKILDQAAQALKPSGRIVYSTCSIEQEEDDAQVQAFLQRHPDFTLEQEQLLVPDENHDGAFAALLRKQA